MQHASLFGGFLSVSFILAGMQGEIQHGVRSRCRTFASEASKSIDWSQQGQSPAETSSSTLATLQEAFMFNLQWLLLL